MKWKTFVIGYALALALLLFAQHRPEQQPRSATFGHIIDLTHSINSGKAATRQASQGFLVHPRPAATLARYEVAQKSTAGEFPTSLDAPAHASASLWSVDQIPPERLFAPLVIIDVRPQVRRDPDYQLSVADIANWEQAHGQIPLGAVVMAQTGWSSRWNSPPRYRNEDNRGVRHSPGFSLQAAQFLVQGRNVVGMGIDADGIDAGDASNFSVRQYALLHSVYQLQNMTNLAQAPATGGLVLVAPAKLRGSSSAPVRVLALAR
ncbi:MAG TPA: cyclase family protein [Terriglobales bacterium]|nr:cyclase family protein [Terriglobales bacterium]